MTTDQKLNLIHLVQYKVKIYTVDKNRSNREKIKVKVHIDFVMNYNNTNI